MTDFAQTGKKRAAYDYVIVGAGSSGCVLATRLAENPDVTVLLLEAGGTDTHPDVQDPVRWPWLLRGELDWGYQSAPLKNCNGRIDRVPRAKMVGGCHSHNASAWVRGHPTDFDGWAEQGCHGWEWTEALRLYQRIEDWNGPPSSLRGVGGPQYVALPDDPHPLAQAFLQSGQAVGAPQIVDHNAESMEGTALFNLTIKDGLRHSVARSYLLPALERSNLDVQLHATVHRLLLSDGSCQGVQYWHDHELVEVHAEQEVILSAGVFGSPQILLLSGIGPAEDLRRLGVDVQVDLCGVGQNFQDHPLLGGINYECSMPLPAARNNGAEATMWTRSESARDVPDLQVAILEFPFVTPELLPDLPTTNCYCIAPSVVQVASRGQVTLRSADPSAAPVIDVNFLDSQADRNAMLAAIAICREMGASEAFADFRKREVLPGLRSRSEMMDFVRQATTTYFHPCGTCKMGTDRWAVVDPELRVYGVTGLRVADASVMPQVTTGNTNAPCVLIGEKAAEMVLG